MAAKTIFAVLAGVFLLLGTVRVLRDDGRIAPASKAWLLVGVIFAAVAAWLAWHAGLPKA